MKGLLRAVMRLAVRSTLHSDWADEYDQRREALGMDERDPRSSAEVAEARGIGRGAWLSPEWRSTLAGLR